MAYIQLVKDTRSFSWRFHPRGPSWPPEGLPDRMLGANQIHHRKPRLVIRLMGPISEMFWLVVFRPTPLKNHGVKVSWDHDIPNPICSMYGIFTYIWVIFRANVSKYSTHGGIWKNNNVPKHQAVLVGLVSPHEIPKRDL